jgi:hypothetical protein
MNNKFGKSHLVLTLCVFSIGLAACSAIPPTAANKDVPKSDTELCKEAQALKKESSNFLVPSQKALWDRHWKQINQAEADIEKYCK